MPLGIHKKNLLELINEAIKVARHRINMENQLYFYILAVNNLKMKSSCAPTTGAPTSIKSLLLNLKKNETCSLKNIKC